MKMKRNQGACNENISKRLEEGGFVEENACINRRFGWDLRERGFESDVSLAFWLILWTPFDLVLIFN